MMKRWIAAFVLVPVLLIMVGCGTGQNDNQMPAAPAPSAINDDVKGPVPDVSGEATEKNHAAKDIAETPASGKASDADTVDSAADEAAGAEASTVNGEADPAAGTKDRETAEAEASDTFRLYLTRDWGAEVLESHNVTIKPDYNLLNYMKEEWQLDTGFGNGFVTGINGLKSAKDDGNRYDWFFYINGELSPVGAGQVKPGDGDVICWDYHMWLTSSGVIENDYIFPAKERSFNRAP